MASLTDLTLTELVATLARKEASALDVAEAHLRKLDEHRALNAFITETPDRAREMARASDARRAKGEAGLLEGVPLAIKDLFCTDGVQTTAASHILEGFVPQYESTVTENLLCGRLGYVSPWRAWRRRFPPDDMQRAFELLDTVGLAGFAHQRADALSGGQRQRVGIARAVMQQPRLLLADEPTSSLDPKTSVEIMELLAGVARSRDIPVLVNMHDVELAKRFADRIVGMSGGRVVFDGPPERLRDDTLTTIYGGKGWLH